MPSLRQSLSRLFTPVRPLPAGMYHYQAPAQDPRNYRLHLRLEPDGGGVLIVNAATVLHLNHTAAEYAYYLVNNVPVEAAAQQVADRYTTSTEQARQDYTQFIDRVMSLVNQPDLDPVTFLDFERQAPYSGHISAPYRLDCALTYRLAESGVETPSVDASAPTERVKRELSLAEWKQILDKAWNAGIPHVVFTGGEPTLRQDLPELVAHAEANDQVSGLISDGYRLSEREYLDRILQAGLDHLMLVMRPELNWAWTALERALQADLFVATHLTLTADNQALMPSLLDRIARMGVAAVSLSANDPALATELQNLRDAAAERDLTLVWDLPVPYSNLHPVALETRQEAGVEVNATGPGRAWLYVEPDGDVLPGQGINQPMGNLLSDPWDKIWK